MSPEHDMNVQYETNWTEYCVAMLVTNYNKVAKFLFED